MHIFVQEDNVKERAELEGRGERGRHTEAEKLENGLKCTCQVSGQVWVIHEAVAGKLYTL